MLKFTDEILSTFRACFTRTAAYQWFVILIVGFMLRGDQLGVTSVIRDLALPGVCYEPMLHFFRAHSWNLRTLHKQWFETVLQAAPLYREADRVVLIGDGVKASKEGRFMPAVKKLFQESENSAKPQYIFGHMFGGLGVLAGPISKLFCIPLSIRLHDGLQVMAEWEGRETAPASHITLMIEDAHAAAQVLGNSILLLDRYYLSVTALSALAELNEAGRSQVAIVTKAKANCTAYELPEKKSGRGRPPKRGQAVKLMNLFVSEAAAFQEADMMLYGKEEKVKYHSVDLLWGQKLYQKLRFVLVEYKGSRSILVSTDLSLEPIQIIRLYGFRQKIECTFREMKQQIGGFCYHFWTKSMPKLNRYKRKDAPHPLEKVTRKNAKKNILSAVRAIECHLMLSVIAMGIVQMISMKFSSEFNVSGFRYLRTPSGFVASEATVMCYFRKFIFRILAENPRLSVTRIIHDKQKKASVFNYQQAS